MKELDTILSAFKLPTTKDIEAISAGIGEDIASATEELQQDAFDFVEGLQELMNVEITVTSGDVAKDRKEQGKDETKGATVQPPMELIYRVLLPIEQALRGTQVTLTYNSYSFEMMIPAGVKNQHRVTSALPWACKIETEVIIHDDPVFSFKGDKLMVTYPVTLEEAEHGIAIMKVPSASGMVKTTLAPRMALSSTSEMILKGQGWPEKEGVGDLLVRFVIDSDAKARREQHLSTPISGRE